MFTKKMEYGYLIVKFLKKTDKKNFKCGKDIIKETKLPNNLGRRILTELSNGNLIKSIRGKNGGFYREDTDVTLLEIFNVLENGKITNIFSNTDYEKEMLKIAKFIIEKMHEIKI